MATFGFVAKQPADAQLFSDWFRQLTAASQNQRISDEKFRFHLRLTA